MSNLGSLWWTMGIKDLTDADLKKINAKFKNLGFDITLTPKILKDLTQSAVPKGIKIELDPTIKNDALARAVEGKTMRVAVTPLLTGFREAIVRATRENPPQAEIGVSAERLRGIIQKVLNRQGFMLNISTVNDNYSKVVQQKLNGTRYTVRIHADAAEITRSVQASLMQVQSRYFGLQVSKDMLRNSIDQALMGKPFNIQIAVMQDQARRAVQNALNNARMVGKDDALAYQRLQTGELKAAQAELARLKAAHYGAADAAKAHATASVSLGSAMGRNITVAGELSSAMASLYSVHAAKQFLSQVIDIGGELEHQKIAMNTIFGDTGKTNELFGQVKGLARTSPFGVMELSKSVKALTAYGVQYNEIYDTAKRLADISAATSVDINRLILAFGKTKSRGFLDGLEAKQFAYANIPIYEMVRKKLEELEGQAVTTQEVMERMRKREISFDIVKDVLWDITDPGGKFYNMQEALAGSVKTSWKLVRDNIELMFGEIAESAVGGTLKSTAEILQSLPREWRTVGAVVGAAAATLGVYKVATLASNLAMDKGTASIYSNVMAEKARSANKLKTLGVILGLDSAEKEQIANVKTLTLREFEKLVLDKKLNNEQILRLGLAGKLTKKQLLYAASVGQISREEAKAIIRGRLWGMNLGRLGNTLKVVGVQIRSLAGAFVSFLPTAGIMAVFGVLAGLWQKNNEQMEKSKEIGDNLFTRATESAKNLKTVLAEVGNEVEKLTDIKIAEAISKLENAIKDYSPTPEKTLRETRLDEDGKIRSTQEYAKALQAEVEALEEAAKLEEKIDIGKISENAMNNAKGVLDDNLAKDLEQYADSFKKADREISKYISDNPRKVKEYVDRLTEIDASFAEATKGMDTYAAKFREMVVNTDKYSIAALAIEGGDIQNLLSMFTSTIFHDERSLIRQWFSSDPQAMKKDRKEFETELKEYMGYVKSALEEEGISVGDGINMSKPVQIMMSRLANTILESAKNLPQDQQDAIRELWNSYFGLDFDDTLIFGSISDNVKDTLDNLPKELADKIRNGISYGELEGADKELVDNLIKSSAQEVEKKFPHLTNKIHDKLESEKFIAEIVFSLGKNAALSGWQRQLNDAIGEDSLKALDISIQGKADINSFIDEARKGYKAANEAVKELKPILIKAGIDFVDGQEITSIPLSLKGNDVVLQAIDEYNKKIRATRAIKDALKKQGIDLDVDPNKKQGTQKDPLAESLKQRFKDIKDAWSEFQKWSKTEGAEAAATRIGESGLFSTLSVEQIPQTVEQYRALVVQLEKELREAGVKGTARESLLNDLLKQLLDIDKTVVDEQLKLALDKVSKEAERQLADWNLFDKIRKATGNQDLAMSIAFGMNADTETDYPALVKKQFAKLAKEVKGVDITFDNTTLKQAKDLGDEIAKSYQDTASKLEKYAREQKDSIESIISEYQSLQDKLTKIDADRDRKIKTVQEFDMSAPDKAKYIQRINVEADYQKFTQSNEYLQFFAGIYALTQQEAMRIGDLIEQNLNRRLQAGTISAEDYYKEIERIRQQLYKLRNVKSDALTFLTGGVKGLNDKRSEQNDAARLKTTQKIAKLEKEYSDAVAKGDMDAAYAALAQLNLAKEESKIQDKIRDKIIKNQQQWQNTLDVANIASNIAGGMSDAFNSIKDMASAFGADTESGAWADIGAVMETLTAVTGGVQKVVQSAMSGDIGGILSGVVSTITTPFTIWAQLHDAKLQKMIERSKEAAQIMQNQYDILEKRMANFLGNAANMKVEGFGGEGGAYGKQLELMKGQLAELEKQRQAELDKKKTDNSVVEDYNKQIEEMKIAIQDFAIEAANAVYGIDLNGWAQQIGDALVDAFAKGEDAAEAFDKTVADIMRSVVKSIIATEVMAPAFEKLRDYLFGDDGVFANYKTGGDFKLSAEDAAGLAKALESTKGSVEDAKEIYDLINNLTGGMLDDKSSSKSGLSAGIQSITEDTADLLASYLNSVRASTSMIEQYELASNEYSRMISEVALPRLTTISESQLRTQEQIAANTLLNAKMATEIRDILKRNINGGGNFRIS